MTGLKKTRLSRTVPYRLTAHGYSLESAYRSHLNHRAGVNARVAYEDARIRWARAHGLAPDDGTYLVELQEGQLSLSRLQENLAVCGQNATMVKAALRRLIEHGLVDGGPIPTHGVHWPNRDMAVAELHAAKEALLEHRLDTAPSTEFSEDPDQGPRQHALSRVIVARNYVSTFPTHR
jgi:hypothetical protein